MIGAGAADVAAAARGLEGLSLEALRAQWRARVGAPPKLRSPELLRLMLAWRLQAKVHGGLSGATRRRLRGSTNASKAEVIIRPGLRMTREWKGVPQEVVATPEGFAWNGKTYPSLSAVAGAITGVKWNGPRFFGLREEAA